MLLTAQCMGVAFLAGYLIGAPLVWLVRRGKPLTTTDWLYAPFIGLGAATLLTHQLAYFDIRIVWSAPAIWVAVGLLWLILGLRYGWRTPYRNCPRSVLLATLVVYLIQGLGLVLNGPDRYASRLHTDRFNYICVSQFLIDVPYSTTWEELGQRAYLADGIKLKGDRIGVMALQGFFAVTAGQPASRMFESTLLLGPALVVPALVLFGRALNFTRTQTLLAAMAGGLLPALTTLHTLCFMANVVAIPFYLASSAASCALVIAPSVRRLLLTALLTATTASLYIELVPLLAATAFGAGVFGVLVGRCRWWRVMSVLAALGVLGLAIYPKSNAAQQLDALGRSSSVTPAENPVSWLQGEATFGTVWVYDAWSIEPPVSRRRIVTAIGVALSAVACVGLLRLVCGAIAGRFKPVAEHEPTRCQAGVMSAMVACLAVGPLLLFYDGKHNYQAMKLLLSLAPVWVIALAGAIRPWSEAVSALSRRSWRLGTTLALVGVVFVCGYGTSALTLRLTKNAPVPMSHQQAALDPSLNALKAALRHTGNQDIVLGIGPGMVGNGELSFAARRNRVWLACPQINDRHALGCTSPDPTLRPLPMGRQLVDLTTVPREAFVLTVDSPHAPLLVEGDKRLEVRYGPFLVWRVGPGPYKLIATEFAMRPPELDHPSPTPKTAAR
ncbi:MAG: hypothetical protein L0241_05540 [Planctomycetia bacterium]|nr:hypothetical protein [Planctomycetia bacterium]